MSDTLITRDEALAKAVEAMKAAPDTRRSVEEIRAEIEAKRGWFVAEHQQEWCLRVEGILIGLRWALNEPAPEQKG